MKKQYELTKEDKKMCMDYAIAEAPTVKKIRESRNQFDQERSIQQTYEGKCAEIAIHKIMVEADLHCSFPDFNVTLNKTHGKDLEVLAGNRLYKISVKNQTVAMGRAFGVSWLFERKYVKSLLASQDDMKNHLLFLCTFNGDVIVVEKIITMKRIAKDVGKFFKPTKKDLPTKCAIYLNDIKGLSEIS